MLTIHGVRKAYGDVQALAGVDLEVVAGEIVGLLGPNGAGKTTLVSIVAGLRRPDAGEVSVDGIDVLRHPKRACERIGFVPQDLGVYPVVTVRENLVLFGELSGLHGRTLANRIDEAAELLDLTELLGRKGGDLSGGEKRRVHTAVALLHRPPLLLLDEPTTGVDVRTRAKVLDGVKALAASGTAIVYSTHYLTEVETLGASVAIIDAGRIIARGSVDDLIDAHGGSAVVLTFDGPAPDVALEGDVSRTGDALRIASPRPAEAVADIIAALGPEARRLHSVEIVRPSLDSVFFALTGRRYVTEDEEADVAS